MFIEIKGGRGILNGAGQPVVEDYRVNILHIQKVFFGMLKEEQRFTWPNKEALVPKGTRFVSAVSHIDGSGWFETLYFPGDAENEFHRIKKILDAQTYV